MTVNVHKNSFMLEKNSSQEKKLYRHFCFMQKISQQVFEEFLKLLCDYIETMTTALLPTLL